jgi:hypothetical protein
MAYRKFKANEIEDLLGLKIKQTNLFTKIVGLEASARLKEILTISNKLAITTEKAVCEYLVSPVLIEIQLHNEDIILFSGEQLNVDKTRNLNGEIDFLFTKNSNHLTIKSPILCITEAKIGLIDKGIPQAAAQMYAMRLFNEREGNPIKIVYGAVTDGKTWRFLKLEGQILYTDLQIIYLDNLPLLLGTLQWVIDFYKEK